jgi:hypothetical protein
MKAGVKRRDPEKNLLGVPVWFHHHGSKMELKEFDKASSRIVISGSAATLQITRRVVEKGDGGWFVNWEVIQSQCERISGCVVFQSGSLRSAFGLSQETGQSGDWLIEEYGADVANQGQYIRWINFLNIPCPGTAHDGDPNISILIDEEMRKAVQQLLE